MSRLDRFRLKLAFWIMPSWALQQYSQCAELYLDVMKIARLKGDM